MNVTVTVRWINIACYIACTTATFTECFLNIVGVLLLAAVAPFAYFNIYEDFRKNDYFSSNQVVEYSRAYFVFN